MHHPWYAPFMLRLDRDHKSLAANGDQILLRAASLRKTPQSAAQTFFDHSLLANHFPPDAPQIYAAGDVANILHPLFGRVRVEHYNNAEKQGAAAARSMLGSAAPYDYIYSFWSDQYDHKLEYVGHVTKWDEFVVRGSLKDGKLIRFIS